MGYAMSRCKNCNVEILDEIQECPLCHCVLEEDENAPKREDMYPSVWIREKKLELAVRIYAFVAIVAEAILLFINFNHPDEKMWSIITAGVFVYIYLLLKFVIQNDSGYRAKMILLTALSIVLIYLIDRVIGYRGWSLNYVLPSGVIMLNVAILLLMIVNFRNWPSYLLFQIFCILCSIFPIILWRNGIITKPLLSEIALAVSVFMFIGTVIIGGGRARAELKRRFHVK